MRVCILFILCRFAVGGQNASWVFPTAGCFASNSAPANATNNTLCLDSLSCQDAYLQVKFGSTLNFTLAATDNSTSIYKSDGIAHCNDATLQPICISGGTCPSCSTAPNCICPSDSFSCSRPCYPTIIERLASTTPQDPLIGGTGFNKFLQDSEQPNFLLNSLPSVYGSPFIQYRQYPGGPYASALSTTTGGSRVTNVYPVYNNLTRVDFAWSLPNQDDVAMSSIPLYQLKFRARYAGFAPLFLINTSSCTKTIYIRVCGAPSFVAPGSKFQVNGSQNFYRILSSPAWSGDVTNSNFSGNGFSGNIDMSCGLVNSKPCLTPPIASVRNGANVLITTMQQSMPTPQTSVQTTTMPSTMPMMGIRVGQTVRVTVAARTLDPTNTLQLSVFEDPGLPIGMNRSSQYQCIDSSTVCLDLMWTPHIGQDNYVHEAALVAVQTSAASIPASQKPCAPSNSRTLIIRFPVVSAVSAWVQPASDLTLSSDDAGNVVVGSPYSLSLQCSSNYQPLVRFANPAERGSLVPGNSSYNGNGQSVAMYSYMYTPVRGDEGTTRNVCFLCGDAPMSGVAQKLCVTLRTRLCAYTVQDGDTLQSLTRRYQLNTNWLNLWNANPAIADPDLQLLPGSRVRLGPTYLARAGDTLESIAGMFSTTVKMILSVNPSLNLLPNMGIPDGSAVCVLACTSQQFPTTFDQWPSES